MRCPTTWADGADEINLPAVRLLMLPTSEAPDPDGAVEVPPLPPS